MSYENKPGNIVYAPPVMFDGSTPEVKFLDSATRSLARMVIPSSYSIAYVLPDSPVKLPTGELAFAFAVRSEDATRLAQYLNSTEAPRAISDADLDYLENHLASCAAKGAQGICRLDGWNDVGEPQWEWLLRT